MTNRPYPKNIVPKVVSFGKIPVDRQTLRAISYVLNQLSYIEEVSVEPNLQDPRWIKAHLSDQFPESSLSSPTLVIYWRLNRSFSMRYEEDDPDTEWWCQWDRHLSSDHSWNHFHHPPAGDLVEEISWTSEHPIDILLTVLTAIKNQSL